MAPAPTATGLLLFGGIARGQGRGGAFPPNAGEKRLRRRVGRRTGARGAVVDFELVM